MHIPREKWLNYLQTGETLIRRRILRRLIWVCTVCQLPFYGSPDYNGLKRWLSDRFISSPQFKPGHNVYIITKTYLYNFDPLKPHFYIVKLGFTGVHIIFLISIQNIDCGYSLEPSRQGGSNEYSQSMFWAEIGKISEFFIWKFSVFGDEIFNIFE